MISTSDQKIVIQVSIINDVCNNCQCSMLHQEELYQTYAWGKKQTKGLNGKTFLHPIT